MSDERVFREGVLKYAKNIEATEPGLAKAIRNHVEDFMEWYKQNPGAPMDGTVFKKILGFEGL